MTGLVSKETAHQIWLAYREIETGAQLAKELRDHIAKGIEPTPLDSRFQRGKFELGVPTGGHSSRLLDLSPQLALTIVETHVGNKRQELERLSNTAAIEVHDLVADRETIDALRAIVGAHASMTHPSFQNAKAALANIKQADSNGRLYARLSELEVGRIVETDAGFTCMGQTQHVVQHDPERPGREGLFIACADGQHFLDGQADDGDTLIGIYDTKTNIARGR